MDTDNELVNRYVEEGDSKAISKLLSRHKRSMMGTIINMIKDDNKARDVYHDAVEKILVKIKSKYEEGNIGGWMHVIVRNQALDYLRKTRPYLGRKESIEDEKINYNTPQTLMESTSDRKDLVLRIEQLPDPQKTVVIFRYYYGLPFKEIAELTGCSINTAIGRHRYGILNLRRNMPDYREKVNAEESIY